MANPDRSPGKYGRKPPDSSAHLLMAEHYLKPWEGPVQQKYGDRSFAHPTPYLPSAVGVIDRASMVHDWGMDVNGPDPANPPYAPDGLGCCTISESAHCFLALATYAGYDSPVFSADAIVTAYSACGGYIQGDSSTDNGCVVSTVLAYMKNTGLPDTTGKVHRLAGYATIDPRNRQLCAQVLDAFGCVYLGGLVQQAQESQFASNQPWQWVPPSDPSSQIAGGHAYGYAYRGAGGTAVHGLTTWGVLQHATGEFLWHSLDPAQGGEAYLLVSEDWISANGTDIQGLDLQQLVTDMNEVA